MGFFLSIEDDSCQTPLIVEASRKELSVHLGKEQFGSGS